MLSFTACGILFISFGPCAWPGTAWTASASATAVESVEAANKYRFIARPFVEWRPRIRDRDGSSLSGGERLRVAQTYFARQLRPKLPEFPSCLSACTAVVRR